ncbi:hypothetical protein GC173_17225 [bacterium]|nr:hypothetical protein [bacterium]
MPRLIRCLLVGVLCLGAGAGAQEDHIGHERHKMHHGEPHARVQDATRFFTDREGHPLDLPSEEEGFVFGVFGDRTGGPPEGVSILADAVHDVNLFEPDLVMTVGDLVQGYNASPLWMDQMREYKGIMNELLCPWFPVSGNHDIYWRGENKPLGEHEQNYEMHFGPLWYAFEHKNSWFIALYSDEGDPVTGEKTFHKPSAQRMSDRQFEWLQGILKKAHDADHVFLFLHHPRWLGGNYGKDWDRVHKLLVDSGNVTAVFAGHIHRMRSDPKDGIEYITLATVGGGQAGAAPSGGWLHHYNLVTVRKNQVAVVSVPVGKVLDPRAITGEVSEDTGQLARLTPKIDGTVTFAEDHSSSSTLTVTVRNPTDRLIEVTLIPDSDDSRWLFGPDHRHFNLKANEVRRAKFEVLRAASPIDDTFRAPMLALNIDYLADGWRYPIPEQRIAMPLDVPSMRLAPSARDMVLELRKEGDAMRVRDEDVKLPDGPFTLEAWFEGDSFEGRTALVAKMQGCEYGIFVSDGKPSFSVHLKDKYVDVDGRKGALKPGRLHHLAGVFDGSKVRLYLDGRKVDEKPGSGKRTRKDLDLIVGGDVDGDNKAVSTFRGRIHGVRLSTGARYTGESFSPTHELSADGTTIFATDFDTHLRDWVMNDKSHLTHGRLLKGARLVEAK